MSLAPNALLPLFSGSKRSNLSREQARYQGVKGSAVAGNSFPEALRPSLEATMSGDPAPGSRASAPLARETVSALRPAAALPCPAGPSSWRHLHETSRTRKGGCGERHRRLLSAPATPPTRPSPKPEAPAPAAPRAPSRGARPTAATSEPHSGLLRERRLPVPSRPGCCPLPVPVQSAERLPFLGCQAGGRLLALAARFSRRHFLFLITESGGGGGGSERHSAGFHGNAANSTTQTPTPHFPGRSPQGRLRSPHGTGTPTLSLPPPLPREAAAKKILTR